MWDLWKLGIVIKIMKYQNNILVLKHNSMSSFHNSLTHFRPTLQFIPFENIRMGIGFLMFPGEIK